ncbi:MAG: biotin--[acetyl-CoA-carboxylase] ligase [Candidatus Bathyarchaeota archaeon]|jgi:BirA family biotin operon repressor/biotin-[acetyl-CoA-carboxylase] ligase|nr:biotin--[acetyl-CoA-carboxylase] ligase [Candidatus Bathyarchaeota archaeon]
MKKTINIDKIHEGLCTKHIGARIIFLHETSSTNDLAKELAFSGSPEGTVVLAEAQTNGRGRLGREWVSPRGGLYFSVILRPRLAASEAAKLVFAAGLAVVEALDELYCLRTETKWPNDVIVNGRKVCGILSEMNMRNGLMDFVVVGFGVNANFDIKKALPEPLWANATSLWTELGRKIELGALFKEVLERLEKLYNSFLKNGSSPVLREWKKHAAFFGEYVEVISGNEYLSGLALDIEDDGSLTIKLDDGKVKHVFAGDVSLRRKSNPMSFK